MPANREMLLPSGFEDLLPPKAQQEAEASLALIRCFSQHGYLQVKPPLLEYRDTAHSKMGAAIADSIFETQDPLSAQTLCLRADTTVQVARIAANQLKSSNRPLRLSYAEQIVRRRENEQRLARQFSQVGIEIVGLDASYRLSADVEAIRVMVSALKSIGIDGVLVDLTLPSLVRDLATYWSFSKDQTAALAAAMDARDVASVKRFEKPVLAQLLDLNGDAKTMISKLKALDGLPNEASIQTQVNDMAELVERLDQLGGIETTLDVCEQRGTAYHKAIGFNLFCAKSAGQHQAVQLGAGGRYETQDGLSTGASLYLDAVLKMLPAPKAAKRILVPLTLDDAKLQALHEAGLTSVFAAQTDQQIAIQQACDQYMDDNGEIKPVD